MLFIRRHSKNKKYQVLIKLDPWFCLRFKFEISFFEEKGPKKVDAICEYTMEFRQKKNK